MTAEICNFHCNVQQLVRGSSPKLLGIYNLTYILITLLQISGLCIYVQQLEMIFFLLHVPFIYNIILFSV